MRLNLDLQPYERKKVAYYCPSNLLVIIFVLITIMHYTYCDRVTRERDFATSRNLAELEKEYAGILSDKASLISRKNLLNSQQQEIVNIKEKLSLQKLSWYTLFFKLEEAVPEKLFISAMNYEENSDRVFKINGEAAGMADIIEFTDNLLNSGYFSEVSIIRSEKTLLENFALDVYRFEIQCRFLG